MFVKFEFSVFAQFSSLILTQCVDTMVHLFLQKCLVQPSKGVVLATADVMLVMYQSVTFCGRS